MNPIDKLFGKVKKKAKKTVTKKIVKAAKSKSKKPALQKLTEYEKEDISLEKSIEKKVVKDSRGLTPRQLKFIKWHLLAMDERTAAIRAGYSEKSASQIASELLSRPAIKKEIKKRVKGIIARSDDKIATMIEHLYICAYYDPSDIVDNEGAFFDSLENLKKKKLTYAIAGIETKLNAKGDRYTVIKLADKKSSREQLGKYLQMFTDKIELTGGLTLNIGKPPEMVKPQEENEPAAESATNNKNSE